MTATSSIIELAERTTLDWAFDPVAFAEGNFTTTKNRFGEPRPLKLWSGQARILRAAALRKKIAVKSGHKIGKSSCSALLALWWVTYRPNGRVLFTSSSDRQVREILWPEVKAFHGRAIIPLGGDVREGPEGGIRWPDGRSIIGFTSTDVEKYAGFSGADLLIVADESSGISHETFEVFEGNLAGGGTLLMLSNPTRTDGYFHDAFNDPDFEVLTISSWGAARAGADGEVPEGTGLATLEYCREMKRRHGENSPTYKVRVLGEFVDIANDRFISKDKIKLAQDRWTSNPPRTGETKVGVDVARFGGDRSVIVWSRSDWVSIPKILLGSDTVEVADAVEAVVNKARLPHEEEIDVRIDVANSGGGVADILKRREGINVVEYTGSDSSVHKNYHRMRDCHWGSLLGFIDAGGRIPPDRDVALIARDISAPKVGYDNKGKIQVESKKEIRKRLRGKSTDIADAIALAVFEFERLGDDYGQELEELT